MKVASCCLKSRPGSDLMFGKPVFTEKLDTETHGQYEERTWKEKVHVTEKGDLCYQPFALKNALEAAAKWLSLKIPGEGKKTFTKRFACGVLVIDQLMLTDHEGRQLTMKDVEPRRLFVPSDGQRGSSRRVERIFPTITEWMSDVVIHILDDKISESVLSRHLEACGNFCGFGSMRVGNGGINGRFAVSDIVLTNGAA